MELATPCGFRGLSLFLQSEQLVFTHTVASFNHYPIYTRAACGKEGPAQLG